MVDLTFGVKEVVVVGVDEDDCGMSVDSRHSDEQLWNALKITREKLN